MFQQADRYFSKFRQAWWKEELKNANTSEKETRTSFPGPCRVFGRLNNQLVSQNWPSRARRISPVSPGKHRNRDHVWHTWLENSSLLPCSTRGNIPPRIPVSKRSKNNYPTNVEACNEHRKKCKLSLQAPSSKKLIFPFLLRDLSCSCFELVLGTTPSSGERYSKLNIITKRT